jgi:hypothetical protein
MRSESRRNWNFLPKGWSMGFRRTAGGDSTVRSIEPPRRSPVTPIERRLASALKETGTISATELVKRTAADLYEGELRSGAAAVDIGLLGERLFDRDIIRELYAGDGILWDITRKSGIS